MVTTSKIRQYSTIASFFILINPISVSAACDSSQHRAFDFWVGEWAVTNQDGSAAGSNTITLEQNGCVLRESWTSAKSPFSGTSLNFYNASKKQWQQLWIDNGGGFLELNGNIEGGAMVLKSIEQKDENGKPFTDSISWTKNDDGSVRQTWVRSSESGDAIVFDGLYSKADQVEK